MILGFEMETERRLIRQLMKCIFQKAIVKWFGESMSFAVVCNFDKLILFISICFNREMLIWNASSLSIYCPINSLRPSDAYKRR